MNDLDKLQEWIRKELKIVKGSSIYQEYNHGVVNGSVSTLLKISLEIDRLKKESEIAVIVKVENGNDKLTHGATP